MALLAGATVVRLGPMFGGGRTRDVLHDILAGRPVFISAESRYAYVDVEWAGKKIVDLLGTSAKIHELGAPNAVRLADIAERFSSASSFEGNEDTQIPNECPDGPDAAEVFAFAEREYAKIDAWR